MKAQAPCADREHTREFPTQNTKYQIRYGPVCLLIVIAMHRAGKGVWELSILQNRGKLLHHDREITAVANQSVCGNCSNPFVIVLLVTKARKRWWAKCPSGPTYSLAYASWSFQMAFLEIRRQRRIYLEAYPIPCRLSCPFVVPQ